VYTRIHTAFVVGAAAIAAFGLVLPTAVAGPAEARFPPLDRDEARSDLKRARRRLN
jgi:hypothetical protein